MATRRMNFFYTVQSLLQHNYGQEPFGLFIVAISMATKGEIAVLWLLAPPPVYSKDIYLPHRAGNQTPPGYQ
jgi:hypothetical protein